MAAVAGTERTTPCAEEDAFVSLALFTLLDTFTAVEGPDFLAVMRPAGLTVGNHRSRTGRMEEGSG